MQKKLVNIKPCHHQYTSQRHAWKSLTCQAEELGTRPWKPVEAKVSMCIAYAKQATQSSTSRATYPSDSQVFLRRRCLGTAS